MLRVDEDEIQAMDREYFAANPGRRLYVRRSVGHLESSDGNAVAVIRINKGMRIRAPLSIPKLTNRLSRQANEDETGMLDAFVEAYPDVGSLLRSSPHFWRTLH